jgi:carbonic anhydrase
MKRTLLVALLKPKSTLRPLIIVITLALALSSLGASGAQQRTGSQSKTAQKQGTKDPSSAVEPEVVDANTALRRLEDGNKRWWGTMKTRNWDAERKATATSQHPFAVVIACMDSRVPPELIFDQGLGDIFVIRVAAPVLNEASKDQLASLEYALVKKHVKLVLVLGHTDCGAVEGAVAGVTGVYLTELLRKLWPAITYVSKTYNRGQRISPEDTKNRNRVSIENARVVAGRISAFGQDGVKVTWGLYDTGSGVVAVEPKEPWLP